jgi:hypothetical protein
MLADHASLRDPYNPQGMVDQHAPALLTTGATVKIDHANNVDYCLGEAFRQLKARKGPFVFNRISSFHRDLKSRPCIEAACLHHEQQHGFGVFAIQPSGHAANSRTPFYCKTSQPNS